jgi:hypothetical protein
MQDIFFSSSDFSNSDDHARLKTTLQRARAAIRRRADGFSSSPPTIQTVVAATDINLVLTSLRRGGGYRNAVQ